MQEPRPDTNFTGKCSLDIYLYSCKNTMNFNILSIFKKHCCIYITTIMLTAICFTTNKTFYYIILSFKYKNFKLKL